MYKSIVVTSLAFVSLACGSYFANAGEISNAPAQFRATAPEERTDYYPYTIGVEGTTLGGGASVGWRFTDLLGVSTGFDYFSYNDTDTIKGIKINGTVQLLSEPVTLNIYPWREIPLHFDIGLLVNQNMVFGDAAVVSHRTYDIDGTHYASSDVGHLHLGIDQNPVAPYLGVGGNLFYFDSTHHWALTGAVGVAYMGDGDVTLDRSGGVPHDTALGRRIDRSLSNQQSNIKGYADDFAWWPIAKVGVGYSF